MSYKVQEIANAAGVAISTLHNYIAKLKKEKKFKKTAVGKIYNDTDGKKLAELIGFDYSKLEKQKSK